MRARCDARRLRARRALSTIVSRNRSSGSMSEHIYQSLNHLAGEVAMMIGSRYIKRVDGSRAVYEVTGRRNEASSEPVWVLRATDGSRREEYATDDALRQEWMRV
jgi:hypothetical protein